MRETWQPLPVGVYICAHDYVASPLADQQNAPRDESHLETTPIDVHFVKECESNLSGVWCGTGTVLLKWVGEPQAL